MSDQIGQCFGLTRSCVLAFTLMRNSVGCCKTHSEIKSMLDIARSVAPTWRRLGHEVPHLAVQGVSAVVDGMLLENGSGKTRTELFLVAIPKVAGKAIGKGTTVEAREIVPEISAPQFSPP